MTLFSGALDDSQMVDSPLDVLMAEVEKCDVRCANCHAIRHATVINNKVFAA